MYTHMIKQRKRSLGTGFFGSKRGEERKRVALNAASRQKGVKGVADASWATGGPKNEKNK